MKKTVLHRAMCVTGSWARSWGLETKVHAGRLVVAGKVVMFSGPKRRGHVVLNAKRILAQDHDEVQEELKVLAKAFRIKPPPPVRRAEKDQVAKAGDHEARAMRLTAFARSPNPPNAVLREHLPTIKREADCAHRRYRFLAEKMGYSPHDFLNIGMTYTVVYLHRKADIFSAKSNGGRLTQYLRQEFARWAKVTTSDLRSIIPDAQGMEVSDFMGAPVSGASLGRTLMEGYYTTPEHSTPEAEDPGHDENYYLQRRETAKVTLTKKLMDMPHDQMVETLSEVAVSRYQDTMARELASKLLRQHARSCTRCAPAVG